jgi:hypothetical protein
MKPLPPNVHALLRAGLPASAPPSGVAERLFAAIEAGTPPGGGAPTPPSGHSSGALRAVRGGIAARPLLAVTLALVTGGIVGVLARPRPEMRIVYREAAPIVVPTVAAPPPPVESAVPEVHAEAPVATPARDRGAAPIDTAAQLAAEGAILDVARTSIARGEGDKALAAVDRHAAHFPHGLLAEEREALGVRALVAAGRPDDAKARAARFRERYPNSLFRQAIESVMKTVR